MDNQENDQDNNQEPEVFEVLEDTPALEEQEEPSELEVLQDKYLRILAEFDNFRKRTSKEKASMYDDGLITAVAKVLPTLDNLLRALSSAPDKEDALYKGVDMTLAQLVKALEELGVEEVLSGAGEAFDPERHFAVAHVQDEALAQNVVAEELQKGYSYKNRIIRHAMVKAAN